MVDSAVNLIKEGTRLKHETYIVGPCIRCSLFSNIYKVTIIQKELKAPIESHISGEFLLKEFAPKVNLNDELHQVSENEIKYSRLEKAFLMECERVKSTTGLTPLMKDFYIDSFNDNGKPFLVMSKIGDLTLRDFITQESDLHNEKKKRLILSLLHNVKLLHKNGIVHADISPGNIVVERSSFSLALIDYGSSPITAEDKLSRKEGYSAPEIYEEYGTIGTWSDIYSIGAVVVFITTREDMKEADSRISDNDLTLLDNFPYNRVLKKSLTLDAKKRYQTVNQIYIAIFLYRIRYFLIFLILLVSSITVLALGTTWSRYGDIMKQAVLHETSSQDDLNSGKGEFRYVTEDGGVHITGYEAEFDTDPVIPEFIDGLPVKSIRGMNANVTSIGIPEGIERIEAYAFQNCRYLETINIPDSMEFVDKDAFLNCSSLRNIQLSASNPNYALVDKKLIEIDSQEIIFEIKD